MFLCNNLYADKLLVPFECYPKEVQKLYIENGLKLDLDRNDKTPDSWGFLINEGGQYWIYTYKPVTDEELYLMLKIMGFR